MTKDELEREARINLKRRFGEFFPQLTISYVMGAEPREKRIAELEKKLTEKVTLESLDVVSARIKELEKENAELKEHIKADCIDCTDYYKNKRLEKENAELKSGCRTCVFTDSPCVPSDYPSKEGVCSHYKNVFEENAELKKKNLDTQDAVTMQMYTNKANKEIADKQLTKAKEIIREYAKWECEYCDYKRNPNYVKEHCSQCQKYPLHKEAESFLNSEVEK